MGNKYRGSALITALFIMTLVAIAATALISTLQMDIYRTQISITKDKLYLASELVTFWSMNELSQSDKISTKTQQKNGQIRIFPTSLAHTYPETSIQGKLIDLQSRLNINNLRQDKFQIVFYSFLKTYLRDQDDNQLKMLVNAGKHWISPPPVMQTSRDEWLDSYLSRRPPYYPAYQPMINVSEWMLIKGFHKDMYTLIASHLSALPETTPLNLNTADPKSIMALGAGLSSAQVNEIITRRGRDGIQQMADIQELLKKLNISAEDVTLESQYFLSEAIVQSGDLRLTNSTVLQRKKDKQGHIHIKVLQSLVR